MSRTRTVRIAIPKGIFARPYAAARGGRHKAVCNSYPLNCLYSQLLASVIRTMPQRQTHLHPVLASLPHARTLRVAAERN